MTQEEIEIASRDYWFKVVDMLQQNWAIIEPGKENAVYMVYFIDDNSGVFDQLEFNDAREAERQLKINGFERFAENNKAGSFITPPPSPFHRSSHPHGPIYSSGQYWKS